MSLEHYSVRRLNPFSGVTSIIACDNARAFSLDGEKWEVQVLAEVPNDWWGCPNGPRGDMRFFRFGTWSRDSGLRKVPINPIMDVGSMLEAAEPVTTELKSVADSLPFKLKDLLELWLLDHKRQPLALLATALPGEDIDVGQQPGWYAAAPGDRNLGCDPADSGPSIADRLEALLRNENQGGMHWFKRESPGTGSGDPLDAGSELNDVPAVEFPDLPIRPIWNKDEDQQLVNAWIHRMAPQLLCLPYLHPDTRRGIEHQARESALAVNALWRLYPKDVDSDLIKSARIEARIRTASVNG